MVPRSNTLSVKEVIEVVMQAKTVTTRIATQIPTFLEALVHYTLVPMTKAAVKEQIPVMLTIVMPISILPVSLSTRINEVN